MDIKKPLHYIYLLREREFITLKENVYTIGKTKQENTKRFNSYPKGSQISLLRECINCDSIEKQLIEIFKEKYEQCRDYGTEYFKGDHHDMIKIINDCIDSQIKAHIENDKNNDSENDSNKSLQNLKNDDNEQDINLIKTDYMRYECICALQEEKLVNKNYRCLTCNNIFDAYKLWENHKMNCYIQHQKKLHKFKCLHCEKNHDTYLKMKKHESFECKKNFNKPIIVKLYSIPETKIIVQILKNDTRITDQDYLKPIKRLLDNKITEENY